MANSVRRAVRSKRVAKTRAEADSAADVFRNALGHFKDVVHPTAVTIFTPFKKRVSLASLRLPDATAKFIARYEPRAATDGLFPHQAEFLKQNAAGKGPHFILTSATGSGKSLCFWAWVMDRLLKDPKATALLCFPTQALMWGQAKRLERLSDAGSLAHPMESKVAFGGKISVGKKSVEWTVWKGSGHGFTVDKLMAMHADSDAFSDARIRIATLDKAHFSLLQQHREFTENLSCIVLDETHAYDGMFGANVHFFLKRLAMARELLGKPLPSTFLASATLSDPVKFGAALLSLEQPKKLLHIGDATAQQIEAVSLEDASRQLEAPPKGGLLRVVLFIDNESGEVDLTKFLSDADNLGPKLNAIYFTESKFRGRHLALRLHGDKKNARRHPKPYDGDLPPEERRAVEDHLNAPTTKGMTVVATSALELGVDIESLDVCLIDQVPPARQDLLQRIGRVGRRDGRPGLVILAASMAPIDRDLLANPEAAFRLDTTRTLPLPVHVDLVRWRHMLATFNEGLYREYAGHDWQAFSEAMENHFGESPGHDELKNRFRDLYGDVEAMDGKFWAHNGFRASASASQGKVPLIECSSFDRYGNAIIEEDERKDVAWIEDTAVFRDAHPEGIFLGHDGRRWQVTAYQGDWKIAKNIPAGTGVSLGKWLKTIKAIYVQPVRGNVATRGDWKDSYKPYEFLPDLPEECEIPARGQFEYGLWDFSRKWKGYKRVDLSTGKVQLVKMGEVVERFQQACQDGDRFPFLHTLTYRTFGWRWNFDPKKPKPKSYQPDSLSDITASLLERFVTASLECSPRDVMVCYSKASHTLEIFDTTPGGNGLSQAALQDGRMGRALDECFLAVTKFARKGRKAAFKHYVAQLLNQDTDCDASEVIDVISDLRDRWQGGIARAFARRPPQG